MAYLHLFDSKKFEVADLRTCEMKSKPFKIKG